MEKVLVQTIQVMRDDLLGALKNISGVIEASNTMPVLACVLLRASGNQMSLMATNTEVQIEAKSPITGLDGDVAVVVSCKKLMDICRTMNGDALIDLSIEGSWLIIKADGSHFKLAVFDELLPQHQENAWQHEWTCTQSELALLLASSQYAMASSDPRHFLNALLLNRSASQQAAVATDGHRLALMSRPIEASGADFQALLPRKSVVELIRLLQDNDDLVTCYCSDAALKVVTHEFTLMTNLIDGKFPDYQQIIPKDHQFEAVVSLSQLKQSLSRVAIMAENKKTTLVFEEHTLALHTKNANNERAEERMTIHYNDERIEIALNIAYMMDVLNIMTSESLVIQLSDSGKPLVLKEKDGQEGGVHIIMPLLSVDVQ
ncbi:MAG: DNA polymerase III subunit beta [Candidatus Comchoanobacterales bacterium]